MSPPNFPSLEARGLKREQTKGDGNCLFRALSEQLYGDEESHGEVRLGVVQYLRDHPEVFKHFVNVDGERRNPKRKSSRALSGSRSSSAAASSFEGAREEEIDAAFVAHVDKLAREGTWGDNLAVVAFSYAYETEVKVYHMDGQVHVVRAPIDTIWRVAHVAFDNCGHYDTVRNISGRRTGLPNVRDPDPSKIVPKPEVDPAKIKEVLDLLPHLERAAVIKALEESNRETAVAVRRLAGAHAGPSPALASSPGSSSVERDYDSDDEELLRPKKKSRAAPAKKINKRATANQDSGSDYEPSKGRKTKRPVKKATGARKPAQKRKVSQAKSSSMSAAPGSGNEMVRVVSNSSSMTSFTSTGTPMPTDAEHSDTPLTPMTPDVTEIAEVKNITDIKETTEAREPIEVKKPIEMNKSIEITESTNNSVDIKQFAEAMEPSDIKKVTEVKEPVKIKDTTEVNEFSDIKEITWSWPASVKQHTMTLVPVELKEKTEVKEINLIKVSTENTESVQTKEVMDIKEVVGTTEFVDTKGSSEMKETTEIQNLGEIKEVQPIEEVQHDNTNATDYYSDAEVHIPVFDSDGDTNFTDSPSESEADEEFCPEGDSSDESDFDSGSPCLKSKTFKRNKNKKTNGRANMVHKHTKKDSKKCMTPERYLEESIESIESKRATSI